MDGKITNLEVCWLSVMPAMQGISYQKIILFFNTTIIVYKIL
jgi:hypothetical protein